MSAVLATAPGAAALPVGDFDQAVLDQLISSVKSLDAFDRICADHRIQRDHLTDEIMMHAAVQFGLGKVWPMGWYKETLARFACGTTTREKILYLQDRGVISLKAVPTDMRRRDVIPTPLCMKLCALRVRLLFAQPIAAHTGARRPK
jgi:hypothetical protein